ncbi:hypothetical protein B0H67DRAFT_667618 [Lasiosphaeris hirsuta]|uniref:NAD-dependent epimerase/dehydratase domain-containing protein n=1 Tax=Lasiosphaeris hirsuta TaxID=260670 RepID=A0AA40DRM5_9PEZI|nr:hypothetical protein B0H67DRAFT_667618 [Lasiosphaeris hirsuta]
MTTPTPRALTVLVIGANGFLGSALCRSFLHTAPPTGTAPHYHVFGLIRRAASAAALTRDEITPIVAPLSSPDLLPTLLAYSPVWDVIATCTEPSRTDPAAEARHWEDVLELVRALAGVSVGNGVRPLVLWSSGCWAEGVGGRSRGGGFDVAVLRATPLFGYSSSYYGVGLEYVTAFAAATEGKEGRVLKFTADADTILHGVHVDDCADGYVALATTALSGEKGRAAVAGQAFNISGKRYETLREFGTALAAEYGFPGGAEFGVSPDQLPKPLSETWQNYVLVFGYSQWVGSNKIRQVTGWADKRPLFSDNLFVYRRAYEAAKESDVGNVTTVSRRLQGDWSDERALL